MISIETLMYFPLLFCLHKASIVCCDLVSITEQSTSKRIAQVGWWCSFALIALPSYLLSSLAYVEYFGIKSELSLIGWLFSVACSAVVSYHNVLSSRYPTLFTKVGERRIQLSGRPVRASEV